MKGLILSGGHGTRLRPITYSQQKQLIPIGNKPILFYAIKDLIEAGVDEIFIVVGPNREQVMETVNGNDWPIKIDFVFQEVPKGLAHAVKILKHKIGNNSFVMYLGDNVLKYGIKKYAEEFNKNHSDASILLTPVKNPRQFGVAVLDDKGDVIGLVEKPEDPPSNLALVGIYFFKPIIFEAVENIKPSWRGELEITDAIQWLIENNYSVKSSLVEGWWKDTGKTEDILEANRLLLDGVAAHLPERFEGYNIKGRVQIGEDTKILGSAAIKGPVVIGDNCQIKDSYIGPYTSIGDNCNIINTEVEDSVIMADVNIVDSERIIESLIGRGAMIKSHKTLPKGHKFVLGDNSEVLL